MDPDQAAAPTFSAAGAEDSSVWRMSKFGLFASYWMPIGIQIFATLRASAISKLNSSTMASSRKIDDLDPVLAYAFGKAEAEWNLIYPTAPKPYLTCTHRPAVDQTALYNQPTDKKDNDGDGKVDEADEKVTNAKAGQSAHNFLPSLALDVAFKLPSGSADWDPKLFIQFSKLMLKTPGITWGGNFKSLMDRPHFERTGWETLAKKMA